MHWLIWVIIFILAIFVILKIVKTIMKALIVITSITIIILIVFGIILAADISDFNRNFRYSSKMILLEDKGRIIAGVTLDGGAADIPEEDLQKYSEQVNQKNYEEVIGRNYKLMILNIESIEELEFKEIAINQTKVKKKDVPAVLRSDAPIKFDVFGELVKIISADQLFIFQQYKKRNLRIYPETLVFKLVKAIPYVLIKSLVSRGVEEVKTRTNESLV